MFWFRSFYYLIDNLNTERAVKIKNALRVIPFIKQSNIRVNKGMIEVIATKNVEDQIRMACDIAGATFRTSLKKAKVSA
ncbi:MAG TPA: hypothetical protein VMX75_04775 [Spirochaetia bacterium]|nr:hypothetical protein [Spirochaetia bacterium]